MKRILAGLMALTTVLLTACGETGSSGEQKNSPAAEIETSAAETTAAETEAESETTTANDNAKGATDEANSKSESSEGDKSESSAEDSSKASGGTVDLGSTPITNNIGDDELNAFTVKNDTIIANPDDEFDEPIDSAELDRVIKMAMMQYEAARSGDFEKFCQTLNMNGFFSNDSVSVILSEETEDYRGALYDVAEEYLYALYYYVDKRYGGMPDYLIDVEDEEDILAAFVKEAPEMDYDIFREALEDEEELYYDCLSEIEWYIEYAEVGAVEPLTNDAVVACSLYNISKRNGVTYYSIDEISILDGDMEIDFEDVVAWVKGDEWGVLIDSYYIDENPYPDLSYEELVKLAGVDSQLQEANVAAKSAYNAVAEYLADRETAGLDIDKVFANGDFLTSTSALGLKLGTQPSGEGDKAIIEYMGDYYGSSGGTVYVGRSSELDETYNIFVQYKAPNGIIGQYPSRIMVEEYDKVEFKKYYH